MKQIEKTPYGTIPIRTACPANAGGYGAHETDWLYPMQTIDVVGFSLRLQVCKRCGSVYAEGWSE